jgi:L-asparaginase
MSRPKVLIIYTGGTIGMLADAAHRRACAPWTWTAWRSRYPSWSAWALLWERCPSRIAHRQQRHAAPDWVRIAAIIGEHYTGYDGFVVLHGSDTMAYTASALSFLLETWASP